MFLGVQLMPDRRIVLCTYFVCLGTYSNSLVYACTSISCDHRVCNGIFIVQRVIKQ